MNNIQIINDKVRIIASEQSWIEGNSIQQLIHVAGLDSMEQVVGLPDLHPGRAYPIGAACLSRGRIYPALVGNDIGCGMALYNCEITAKKAKLDKWEKLLRRGAFSEQAYWAKIGSSRLDKLFKTKQSEPLFNKAANLMGKAYSSSFGTIGGGNHFAEFQKVTKIVCPNHFESIGLNSNSIVLLVHSGSRGLGEAVLRQHVDEYGHEGLNAETQAAVDYLKQHDYALEWAGINRQLIAERLAETVGVNITPLLDINHNMVSETSIAGKPGWLHRKGATPADHGLVMIPGSRGANSYLVKPIVSEVSLLSLAHGAGRKWKRTECEARLKEKSNHKSLERTSLGGRVICENKSLMYEEAPEAYKPIDNVIKDLLDAGLIEVIAEFTPIITYKTVQRNMDKTRLKKGERK